MSLRILVYLVTCDSGWVSLEHLLLSWCPPQRGYEDLLSGLNKKVAKRESKT